MATIKTSIMINDMMSQQFRAMNMVMSTVIDSFQSLQSASSNAIDVTALNVAQRELHGIEAQYNQIEEEMRQAANSQNNMNKEIREGGNAADGLMRKIGAIAGAYLTLEAVGSTLRLSDEMSNTTARINMVNDGLQTTAELQEMIFDAAQRSRAVYTQTADLVAKLGLNAPEAFQTNGEALAFAELLNKQFVIAGTNTQGIESATLQLIQALGSGVLRGEELNAVFEAAPNIIRTISDYLGVGIGEIREMASEGMITADIVKRSMFAATSDINKQFESMPMTWAQLWNSFQNSMLQALQPVLETIAAGATYIHDNWDTIAPVFWGIAAAVGGYALAMGFATAATWVATGAAKVFFMTLLTNPIFWIALAIGVVVGAIYQWVQAVGGLDIAWKIAMNNILWSWDMVQFGIVKGVNWILDLWDQMAMGLAIAGTAISNMMGDMSANVLSILQNMVNGAIDIINGFIGTLRMIPGVSIDFIDHVTFGTTAQLENEAARQAREAGLTDYKAQLDAAKLARNTQAQQMWDAAVTAANQREGEITRLQAANSVAQSGPNLDDYMKQALANQDAMQKTLSGTEKNTGKMADSIEMSTEEIAYLKDIAESRAINRVTNDIRIDVKNENHINKDLDIDGIIDQLAEKYEEAVDMLAEGAVDDLY